MDRNIAYQGRLYELSPKAYALYLQGWAQALAGRITGTQAAEQALRSDGYLIR